MVVDEIKAQLGKPTHQNDNVMVILDMVIAKRSSDVFLQKHIHLRMLLGHTSAPGISLS